MISRSNRTITDTLLPASMWPAMDTNEWGLTITIVGVLATVIGLSIAFWQLKKTRTAAEATRDAVTTTESRLAKAELLQLIPALVDVDGSLEDGIRIGADAEQIAKHLTAWRDCANEILGVLEGRGYASAEFVATLKDSADEAARVRAELPDSPDDRRIATKDVRAGISAVCGFAGVVKSQLKLKTED
jgi:hypothetical protein